jgi:hypothetical protein
MSAKSKARCWQLDREVTGIACDGTMLTGGTCQDAPLRNFCVRSSDGMCKMNQRAMETRKCLVAES